MYVEVIVPRHLTYYIEDYNLKEWIKLNINEMWDILDGCNVKIVNDETDFYNGIIENERDYY